MKNIAVWNTAFLGDAILTLPLIQSLHLAYPSAAIDFYIRGGMEPLFSSHPDIRHVYALSKKEREAGQMPALARQIAKRGYSLWICAHTSIRSGIIARLSGAPIRVGYKEVPASQLWFNRRVSRCFGQKEEIERLLGLLEPLTIPQKSLWPNVYLPQSATDAAASFFSQLDGPVLGVHPGSVWPTKRWPYFADIARRALHQGAHVVLFAGPDEKAMADAVRETLHNEVEASALTRLHDLSCALSLPELAAYIARLSCYITNDSGPMHLAWAQHVPVVALFGPTVRDLGFFPRGKNAIVEELNLDCRPCGLHGHNVCPKGHHNCMVRLLPEDVWPDVQRLLF